MTVAVVTDSTSSLPPDVAAREGIGIVPVQVVVGGEAFDETDRAADVIAALRAMQRVTTSRPTPARFADAIAAATARGATEVVIATLSAAMSSTYESALIAAREADVPVDVVDTGTVGMALGFAVLDAGRAANAGADRASVARTIERRAQASHTTFVVDSLEHLRLGGRISAAQAGVGRALQVKPILAIRDGAIVAIDRVRTFSRAQERLVEIVVEQAGVEPVDIAVQHVDAADRAHELADHIAMRLPQATIIECPVGAVIGAHAGPGAVSVAVAPRSEP